MTPSIDDRLASIVRSLTEVILPHLPKEASLAQEQVQLCIGHIQIVRAQLDASPAFEREELDDAVALGRALLAATGSDAAAGTISLALAAALKASKGTDARAQRQAIHDAIEDLIGCAAADGNAQRRARISTTILDHERRRVEKDRAWFAPFGFDTL
jgi:hypothetical protein